MFFLRALLLLCLAAGPAFAQENPCPLCFLEKSQSLKDHGLTLVPVEVRSGKVSLPVAPNAAPASPVYVLAHGGAPVALKSDGATVKMPWGCGAEIDAAVFAPAEGAIYAGNFAVVGKDADKFVEWVPAVPHPACPRLKGDCELSGVKDQKLSCLEAPGLGAMVAQSTGSIEEKNLYKLSLMTGGNCVSFGPYATKPEELGGNVALTKFLGLLRLDGGKEVWLIFANVGYESNGYSALLYDKTKKPAEWIRDEKYFFGC